MANSGGQAGKPSAPESHRPGVFQLDDLRKRVNKDVLEKAHMTEEEYRKFLKEYEEALKQYRPKPRTEPPAGPQPVEHLPSIGGKAVKPGGGTDDLGSDAKALPPAPYRDAYRKFTEQFSRPDKK